MKSKKLNKKVTFRPHSFVTKVEMGDLPIILIPPTVLSDMEKITQFCDKEVGWLGIVERGETFTTESGVVYEDNMIFKIKKVFVPKQSASSASCEISTEGLVELAETLQASEEDFNNIRLWGHSHVYMGTSPSGQDNSQLDSLMKDVTDYFIRLIVNKNGRMEFTLFLKDLDIEIYDVEWVVDYCGETTEDWAKIIADNVQPMTYLRNNYLGDNSQNRNYGGSNWGGVGFNFDKPSTYLHPSKDDLFKGEKQATPVERTYSWGGYDD